ncbi:MAG TPA: hypothetical protein GXX30_02845 [Firmicutes bacterium]|nr:hypothetical protein [Candidatus Fermentithermobacillaceae bacterium]
MEKLQSIDRRVIYLILASGIISVLLNPIGLPIKITEETLMAYRAVDSLKPGSIVVLSFDYGASNVPELHPAAIAILKHAFKKDLNVVCVALNVEGGNWASSALNQVLKSYPEKRYGVDYVNLGYKPGGQVFLEKMALDVMDACAGVDASGTRLSDLPLMGLFRKAQDISLVVSFTAGEPGYPQWISIIGVPYRVPVTCATIAPGVPAAIPLVKSGHLRGVLKGMRGAAEYELLIGEKAQAVSGMDALSVGHLLIIGFIVAGNIGFIGEKFRKKQAGSAARGNGKLETLGH